MLHNRDFARMSDKELIEGLTAVPPNNKLHEYFFRKKCKRFLTYISATLYNEEKSDILIGEFYEYLAKDDWKILKTWEGKNDCSLYSYLASCSLHHFMSKRNAEKKRNDIEIPTSEPENIEFLNHFIAEEEADMPPVWDAYKTLKERDKVILRLLVIEEKEVMDAAHEIWPYINSPYRIHEVTQKHIQSTIAMAKHRALLALMNSMNKTVKN